MLLFLNLEKNHSSKDAQTYLESNQNELLESLRFSLRIPIISKRTKRDETQITCLVQALLKLSGGKSNLRQHEFAEEYKASQNADLFASVLDITRTNQFGEFDSKEICNLILKSPVFFGVAINVQDLDCWINDMRDFLCVGFREGYLVRRP